MSRNNDIEKAIQAFDNRKTMSDIHEELYNDLLKKYPPEEAKKILDDALNERKKVASRKYTAKYDKNNKQNFRMVAFKFNRRTDADILDKLDSLPNKQGYVKALIRADIAKNGR